ncbi:MAG: hypothetical protein ABIU05_00105 [Nitrospirales bacterium]
MSKIVQYGVYIITSLPLYQADTHTWKPEITISWDQDGAPTTRPFHPESTYPTEEEAETYGITFGQRIIDGEVTGLSVN